MEKLNILVGSAVVAIFVWFVRYVDAHSNTFYQFSSVLSGFGCPNEYVLFDGVTSSLISCMFMCNLNGNCEGLDYNKDTKNCRLCKGMKGANCIYQPLTVNYTEGTTTYTKGRGFLVSGISPVPDDHLTEYDSYGGTYTVKQARYCLSGVTGSWVSHANNSNQWIEVRLLATGMVTGVYLSRRMDLIQYVTSYMLYTSSDCNSYINYNTAMVDAPGVFPGVNATLEPATTIPPTPVSALCVRINPNTWHWHMATFFDILGYYP